MNRNAYILFVLVLAAIVLTSTGITSASIVVTIMFSLLALIPLYFGTRDRTVEPTTTETSLATTWLFIRRFLALSTSALMFLGVGFALFSEEMAKNPDRWLAAGFFLLIGLFLVYFAFYGQGMRRYDYRDDIELHEQNKRRYRWRL